MNNADPATVADLDRLSAPLMKAGWTVRARYAGSPALLRIFSSAAPAIGASIDVTAVEPGPDNRWYRSSTGACLAPCSDPASAALKITRTLRLMVDAATGELRLINAPTGDALARVITESHNR